MSDGHIAEKPVYHVAPKEVSLQLLQPHTTLESSVCCIVLQQHLLAADAVFPFYTAFSLLFYNVKGWVNGKCVRLSRQRQLEDSGSCLLVDQQRSAALAVQG